MLRPYLHGGRGAVFPGGGGGHGGGGLDEGGGHLGGRGGGAPGAPGARPVAHQPHAAVDLHVDVALGRHVQHLQAVVVEAGELALERAAAVAAPDGHAGLRVEDGELPACRGQRRATAALLHCSYCRRGRTAFFML